MNSMVPPTITKKDVVPEPAPFTVVQSFAARLRQNQAKSYIPIELETPTHATRQGLPAMVFKMILY